MITIDEDTGRRLAQAPTGDYPDGLAYDPDHHTIWTTNESGGSEPVIDPTPARFAAPSASAARPATSTTTPPRGR